MEKEFEKLVMQNWYKDDVLLNQLQSGLINAQTAIQLYILTRLFPHENKKPCFVSQKTIAEFFGVDKKYVERAIKNATEKGWFTREGHNGLCKRQYKQGPNLIYRVNGVDQVGESFFECEEDIPPAGYPSDEDKLAEDVIWAEKAAMGEKPLLAETGTWATPATKQVKPPAPPPAKASRKIEDGELSILNSELDQFLAGKTDGVALAIETVTLQKEWGIKYKIEDDCNISANSLRHWRGIYGNAMAKQIYLDWITEVKKTRKNYYIGTNLCNKVR